MNQTHETTPRQIFASMPDLFAREPERLYGMNGIYQFLIQGDTGGEWSVAIEGGTAMVSEGLVENPGCTITIADEDFVNMAEKRVTGSTLFMNGRLRVRGRQDLAMSASRVFG
jgi:hypothetical protein